MQHRCSGSDAMAPRLTRLSLRVLLFGSLSAAQDGFAGAGQNMLNELRSMQFPASTGQAFASNPSGGFGQPPTGQGFQSPGMGAQGTAGFGDQGFGGFGAQQGSFGAQQGSFGTQQGGFGAQQGGYGAQQGGFGAQQGGFGAPQGSFGVPQGGFGSQQGGFGAQGMPAQPMQGFGAVAGMGAQGGLQGMNSGSGFGNFGAQGLQGGVQNSQGFQAQGGFGMQAGAGFQNGGMQGRADAQQPGFGFQGGMQGSPSGLGQAGFGGFNSFGVSQQEQAQQQYQELASPEQMINELSCEKSARAQSWSQAKLRFRLLFQTNQPWLPIARELLVRTMEEGLNDLKATQALALQAEDECGLGKLSVQLLSFASVDDPTALVQIFSGFEQLASPVLTMLLDVPWVALAQAGWPIFGMLSQINRRRAQVQGGLNDDMVDGMDDTTGRTFQAELAQALASGDGVVVQRVSQTYLTLNPEGNALATLTAYAAQAVTSPVVDERLQLLTLLQQAMRQVIGNAPELDLALGTKWPLWGMIHNAIDALVPS